MKIVAFLQNVWVKDPAHLKRFLEKHPDMREGMIVRLLFAGGLTGRRLGLAFGNQIKSIIWEEITTEIAGASRTIFPPDYEHIRRVIEKHQPEHILVFGNPAKVAFQDVRLTAALLVERTVWFAPHPAARQADVMFRLETVAAELERKVAA